MRTHSPSDSLHLDPIAGPPLQADGWAIERAQPRVIGRATDADLRLADAGVSRHHARVAFDGRDWTLTDLGSRHGTYLNGVPMSADAPEPLANGDQVRIGPWLFRIRGAGRVQHGGTSIVTTTGPSSRVQRVPERELRNLAQHRLDVLIDCAAQINSASDTEAMGAVALDAALSGAGYARAALVRPLHADGLLDVICSQTHFRAGSEEIEISRSLIEAAAEGKLVRLAGDAPQVDYGQSIAQLGIHSALCAPVELGGDIEAFLYLDARGAESAVQADAAAFVQAIARMCGLAMSNLRRKQLEVENALIEAELSAARQAQELIMPDPLGRRGLHAYALATRPGRVVAGDLFDVVALDDDPNGPTAWFLGDVTGKGIAAAITMARVQTHLRTALKRNPDPASVATEVNRELAARTTDGRFVSLWLGVLDPKKEEIRFIDAGHGYWLLRHAGQPPARVDYQGGIPLGLDEDFVYVTETVPFRPGSRLIVFSDGVTEQTDPAGEMFGLERAIETLQHTTSAEDDTLCLDQAVMAHASNRHLGDDLTIGSYEWVAE